jgi:hypothetical protein
MKLDFGWFGKAKRREAEAKAKAKAKSRFTPMVQRDQGSFSAPAQVDVEARQLLY